MFLRLPRCGHTFCGPCLKELFSERLVSKLIKLPALSYCSTNDHNAYHVPTSAAHLRNTLEAFRALGVEAPRYFCYSCPICASAVKTSPVEAIEMKALIADTWEALVGRSDLLPDSRDRVDESGVRGVGFFLGLFL